MAAFVPVPSVVQAVVGGTIEGLPWAHVLHYQYGSGPPSAPNLQAGSSVLLNQYATHLHVNSHANWILTYATLTDLASQTGNKATTTGSTPGGMAGNLISAGTAMIIDKSIGRRYKGGHPRASLPVGVGAVLQTQTTWTAAFVTTVTNGYAAFITATANGAMWPGVGPEVCVHRKANHVVLNPPITDVVQSYSGQVLLGSMRRRIGR